MLFTNNKHQPVAEKRCVSNKIIMKLTFFIFQFIFRERYVSMAFMKKYIHVAKGIKVGNVFICQTQ